MQKIERPFLAFSKAAKDRPAKGRRNTKQAGLFAKCSGLGRWLAAGFVAVFLFSSCGVFDNLLGKKDKGDEDLMKLLMLGLLAQPAAAKCENNSGFVICIPKGVTFQ